MKNSQPYAEILILLQKEKEMTRIQMPASKKDSVNFSIIHLRFKFQGDQSLESCRRMRVQVVLVFKLRHT